MKTQKFLTKKDTFLGAFNYGGKRVRKEKECLLLGTSKGMAMNSERLSPSSIGLNSSMLWIMGGTKCCNSITHNALPISSTEFVTTERAVNGPTLPEPVSQHCSVLFPGNGNVYLIHSDKVRVANPSNGFTFAQGPSLIDPRYRHMCGTMSIGAQSIIVVAGGLKGRFLATVEILDPLSNKWVEGK